MAKPTTENFDIPKEIFGTGIADAETFNEAMDKIDALLGESGQSWKSPVASPLSLPTTGNNPGDVRVVLSQFAAYVWTGSGWQYLVALDKTHETYLFARAAILTNAYANCVDGVPSNLIGYPQRTNGQVIGIAASFFNPSTCTVNIRVKGGAVLDSLSVVNATFASKVSTAPVSAGQELACEVVGTANGIVATVIVE